MFRGRSGAFNTSEKSTSLNTSIISSLPFKLCPYSDLALRSLIFLALIWIESNNFADCSTARRELFVWRKVSADETRSTKLGNWRPPLFRERGVTREIVFDLGNDFVKTARYEKALSAKKTPRPFWRPFSSRQTAFIIQCESAYWKCK